MFGSLIRRKPGMTLDQGDPAFDSTTFSLSTTVPRPPRLEVKCKANVRVGKTYYNCDVHDISLGGMKIEPIEEYCLGKQVVVVVESLRPIKGEVRWFSERKAGIVFESPLRFEEL